MTYEESLKYLNWLEIFGIKEGLQRTKNLMAKLNEPQNFYETVHVAGTNGKGSVCAMLTEILRQDGRNVGLFTSPHLESYCERISVNGENISEEDFAAQIERVKNCNVDATHFETLTAAAFDYFKRRQIDIAVIEVGLGGTLDSTNVITPKISVITNIALDHENILGDLENIARNKAGIIKPNVSVVTGATGKPLEIIRDVAKKNHAPLYEVTTPIDVFINLRGEYQKFNAAVAMQAAKVLSIADDKILAGLERVHWAGRFEMVDTKFGKILIDGAHNPHGATALRESLDKYFPTGKRTFIFGALADKNFDEMVKILFRADDFVIVTPPNSKRAAKVETLCKTLTSYGVKNIGVENLNDALEKFLHADGLKIAAGSLYLIGDVKAYLKKFSLN
ncbi:MAG: bifunctional folylpolyglutamate synthase/dihydrofolate synthase [Selenomonadaceae bacterium]|nr:bifunctional folylpolyglutamate synthase/dihydrofolate synthase [Selenomonadaceae bacterium]